MRGRDQLWIPLVGRITLARTIDTFQQSAIIDQIVAVTNLERIQDLRTLCIQEGWHKISAIVPGGARRQDSVRLGLDALAEHAPTCRWVMIHDAARPFVTLAMLETGLTTAQAHQASIAA